MNADQPRARAAGAARLRHADLPAHVPAGRTTAARARLASWARPADAAVVLAGMRFFAGAIFVYAGVDKLLDPAFLRASGPGSIGAQLESYARISPLAPLITAIALKAPVLMGGLIAATEVAAGAVVIAAPGRLLFRLASLGLAGLAFTLLLTASWAVRPIYLGNDLPYLAILLALAAAGPGRWTLAAAAWPTRRAVTRVVAGTLAIAGIAVAGAREAYPVLSAGLPPAPRPTGSPVPTPAPTRTPGPTTGPTATPGPTATASGTSAPTATPGPTILETVIGRTSEIKPDSAREFTDPFGLGPGVLVRNADGTFAAFDPTCPHAGCSVGFDASSGMLVCPCHGATFDPAASGARISGPTLESLSQLPIRIDSSGRILLRS